MKYRVIHHTAVERSRANTQFYAVEKYHREKNWGTAQQPWYQSRPSSLGFWGGYNAFVDGDGTFTQTRLVGEETIAQRGHNCDVPERCDSVSVCFALNGNYELFTEAQRETYKKICKGLIKFKTVTGDEITLTDLELTLHKELQEGRTCPGKNITLEYLKELESEGFVERTETRNHNEDVRNGEKILELVQMVDYLKRKLALLLRIKELKELLSRIV